MSSCLANSYTHTHTGSQSAFWERPRDLAGGHNAGYSVCNERQVNEIRCNYWTPAVPGIFTSPFTLMSLGKRWTPRFICHIFTSCCEIFALLVWDKTSTFFIKRSYYYYYCHWGGISMLTAESTGVMRNSECFHYVAQKNTLHNSISQLHWADRTAQRGDLLPGFLKGPMFFSFIPFPFPDLYFSFWTLAEQPLIILKTIQISRKQHI